MVNVYQKAARALFDRFVVNTTAVAVQNESGKYITVKTPLTVEMVRTMLEGGYSLGTYQQQYMNDKLKWICFDFDTDKKNNNDAEISELKNLYVIPFLEKLHEKDISYVVEYSGRRGFHVWIFFSQIISKDLAYSITYNLIGDIYNKIQRSDKYGIDLFPKTFSGKVPNKYGLQVKIPLSRHKASGTYSYFIKDIAGFNNEKRYSLDMEFLNEQIEIVEAIKENEISDVLVKCGFESKISRDEIIDYHKQYTIVSEIITLEDIKVAFCSDDALKIVWKRINDGNLDSLERTILLGIFGHMNCGEDILSDIFKLQNNYNRVITQKMISKYRNIMFPITFKYLYQYFNMEGCPDERKNLYLDDYLIERLGLHAEKININDNKREINFVKAIVNKELNYLLYNDEVYDFEIINALKMMTYYDFTSIEAYIENVEKGIQDIPEHIEYKKYVRKEDDKDRIMVSLGAKERTISTALVTKLIMYSQKDYSSYSYHLNLGAEGDVFYPWVSSWTRYKNDISQYFSVPFFENYYCVKIDFKAFYDSLFLHSAFERICARENIIEKKKFENIYRYLVAFNEKLMRKLRGIAQGVPQGPAYARVMAELTLNELIEEFFEKNERFSGIKIYRYVDDMFVFGLDEKEIDAFFDAFSKFFENRNLFFNKIKTRKIGRIKNLLPVDKNELQEFRAFNYDIFQLKENLLTDGFGKELFDSKYLHFIYRKQKWDINDANLILSDRVDSAVKERYVREFYNDILVSEKGRGSLFRKFYFFVLNSSEHRAVFFDNNDYNKVPFNSINQDNMISCMIMNVDIITNTLSSEQLYALKEFINMIKNENAIILYRFLQGMKVEM